MPKRKSSEPTGGNRLSYYLFFFCLPLFLCLICVCVCVCVYAGTTKKNTRLPVSMQSWRSRGKESYSNLHNITLSWRYTYGIPDKGLRALTACTVLPCLEFQSDQKCIFKSSDVQVLSNLKNVEKLTLKGPSEIGLRLDFIHHLICLRELELISLRLRNTSLESLEGVTRLKTLSIIMCPRDNHLDNHPFTTDRVVRVLRPLTELQRFDMCTHADLTCINDGSLDQVGILCH